MPAARRPAKKAARPAKAAGKKTGKTTARKAPAKKAAKAARKRRAPPPAPAAAAPAQASAVPGWTEAPQEVWEDVPPAPQAWELVEDPAPAPAPAAEARAAQAPFDPATGDWVPVQPAPAQGAPAGAPAGPPPPDAPDAPRKGPAYTFWTVLLWIDLAVLGLNFLAVLATGLVLVFAPGSGEAEAIRDALEGGGSPRTLLVETLIAFTLFGVIPLLWVLGTRRVPLEGTRRYLRLHDPGRGILRGVLLTVPLLVAVAILSVAYIVATEGAEGLDDPQEGSNPAVEAILENLTWPLALVIALCAGIGEEIFFRGLLIKRLGVWGQAVLFGLAHAAGGYPPQILFALGLGVLFGYLVKRGWSLWTLMTAHVLYDLALLALALAYGA